MQKNNKKINSIPDPFTEAKIKDAILPEKRLFPFYSEPSHSKISMGRNPDMNLDNFDNTNHAQNAVQMTREMTTSNGCHVTLIYPVVSRPGVRRKIAEMFVAALQKGMNDS